MLVKEKKKSSLTVTCRSGLRETTAGGWLGQACSVRGMEDRGQRPFSQQLWVCYHKARPGRSHLGSQDAIEERLGADSSLKSPAALTEHGCRSLHWSEKSNSQAVKKRGMTRPDLL